MPSQRKMKMLLLFVVFIMNLPVVDAATNSSADDIGFVQPALVTTAAVVGTSMVPSPLELEENEPRASPMEVEEKEILPDIEMEDSDKKVSSVSSQVNVGQDDTDMEYSVPCDMCGVLIVARNKDDIDKIKHLKSLSDPDELIMCTSCAYDEETDRAAYDLHHNSRYKASRVPKTLMRSVLLASGVPSIILQDIEKYTRLHEIVRQKMGKFDRSIRYNKEREVESSNDQPKSREERILEATRLANRMACPGKKGVFQANICIVCDCHIIGTEKICYLTKDDLFKNDHRIGLKSYNDYYTKEGHSKLLQESELVKQYTVDGMEGLLLSRRSRHTTENGIDTYEACQSCHKSIKKSFRNKSPPKFAIANGYVIGQIPGVIEIRDKDGTKRKVVVDKNKITDIVRAMLAPTRAYGYTFAYFAGAQQSIQGHYVFYEVDQTLVGAVVNKHQQSGANPHVHIVLGGRFTPSQKTIVRKKTEVDTTLVTDLLTWFIDESGHKGFEGFIKPSESDCPPPKIDDEVEEDKEVNREIEEKFDDGTYHFSSAYAPSQNTGVHATQLEFTKSLLGRTPPTLLVHGGDYVGGRSLKIENVIPTAYPWGLGGPEMPRRTHVSIETSLAHYGRLSLPQFLRGDFSLLAHHMLDRRLSYTSGKVKCRSNIGGVPLAEKISRLTVKDLEDVVSGASTNSTATQLLSSVSASCKAMGHTSEAAASWRRVYFALGDRQGLNAVMLTVTPNDLASFSVRVIALAGKEHKMPSLDSTEDQCIADFTLRKEIRLEYPGACSLYFDGVMQIVLEVLLGWNLKEQRGTEDGIFGELDAWGMTVEEQARKTLHAHLLLWSKRLAKMRDELFNDDEAKRNKARADFCESVDKVLSSSYTNNEWIVEHKCGARGKVEEVVMEREPQVLRDARHKILCQDINGKVMECNKCHEKVSTQDIINLALNEWHQNALKDDRTSAKDLTFPLSKERHDIAMYRTSYDMMNDCCEDDPFWGNEDVRRILQLSGDNEHYALHGPRCFKKGEECTSGSFPQAACTSTCIHEDTRLDGEDIKMLEWYLLDGSVKKTAPWMVLPKRPLGCQYLNTHNKEISTIFNCNSNVIIGDASNTYYLTLYGSKSTQKEDSEKKERILKKLIRRLRRLQMERESNRVVDDEPSDFSQGLSMMLSAITASTSRDVVSSTMAHYLGQHEGSRFSASHKPKHLLISQFEGTLGNEDVNFTLRLANKSKADGTVLQWPDSSSNDYVYRPKRLEKKCAYEFTEMYEKQCYSFKDMDANKQDIIAPGTEESERYRFIEGHPGQEFAYLEKLKLPAVAVVSLPKGKLCLLKDLELDNDLPSDVVEDKRENYAKMALMMFYPFRELNDLKKDNSYWNRFDEERARHLRGKETTFWKIGFEILQNMDDREMMMQKDHRTRARDPVQIETKLNVDEAKQKKIREIVPDITQFYDKDDEPSYAESDVEYGEYEDYEEEYGRDHRWSHNALIREAGNITTERLISARLTSDESIFNSSDSSRVQEEDIREHNGEDTSDWFRDKSYPTLLKLISGTLVGVTDYNDIFEDDVMDETLSDDKDEVIDDDVHNITQEDTPLVQDTSSSCNIPTLVGVARKVAHQDKVKLDEKQYIAYEIVACTFLLKLVEEGRNKSTIVGKYLKSALGSSKEEMDQLVEHLKARGGMEQLLMFLTGPAGAGKSTAVKVAERFCFEFCQAVSVMWYDETFLFTACSGSAAAIFGGITIHSAAVLNGKVTDKARETWKKVDIVMIDEISYFSDNDFKKLDRKLKDLKGVPNKPFGGQSIIFSGDFRQFEAILAKFQLYDRNGSGLWESSINCVIILENIHRFKDDPEYGEMLTRLWRDDLTQEDREKINTRVVGGTNEVTLPSTFNGDVVYATSTNKERNSIQAGIFYDHILDTHPMVGNPESPPDHTIIIEAVIQSSKSKKVSTQIGSLLVIGLSIPVEMQTVKSTIQSLLIQR